MLDDKAAGLLESHREGLRDLRARRRRTTGRC